ncbi:hypothetical protein OKA04_12370 [Luteolibacter flavescens]|uniref:Uncharacterized protein n=1 Tax=Luteolibacter flavescens TaxID=1859460 RepID=A0ABT3FPM8_9BACT|nr:hypothetical protein [Luteolibacter flavescens]MCW1885526.1 hypothetical protein [Luteolibacter flavescens]
MENPQQSYQYSISLPKGYPRKSELEAHLREEIGEADQFVFIEDEGQKAPHCTGVAAPESSKRIEADAVEEIGMTPERINEVLQRFDAAR